MASTPHIELDSQAPDTVDGRQIRAVAFQDVRLQYVTGTMKKRVWSRPGAGHWSWAAVAGHRETSVSAETGRLEPQRDAEHRSEPFR